MLAHARKYWRHHLALAVLAAATIIGLVGYGAHHFTACGTQVDTAGKTKKVCGVRLTPKGQAALKVVAASPELGDGAIVTENPPSAVIQKLNQQAALQAKVIYPTLAAPEPTFEKCPVRNYSSRHGQRPSLWVIHDTESPNVSGRGPPGKQDIRAICSWFNNPNSQASSNYTTDADGNTLLMVALTDKAWTQAGFNSVAISDEFIGYASQTSWPFAQLHAGEQLAAADLKKYGIPAQHGSVNTQTCQVIRPGFVMHADLGICGGGHHDAGTNFPVKRFIADVYRILHPKGPDVPAWYVKAKTIDPMWAWFAWRDHSHPAALRPKQIPAKVPAVWWKRYAVHAGRG
jgi:hypothetical protein